MVAILSQVDLHLPSALTPYNCQLFRSNSNPGQIDGKRERHLCARPFRPTKVEVNFFDDSHHRSFRDLPIILSVTFLFPTGRQRRCCRRRRRHRRRHRRRCCRHRRWSSSQSKVKFQLDREGH